MAKKNAGKKSAKTTGPNSSPMNVDLLEQITRLMRDNDLNTVDVRDGDRRVILKRGAVAATGAGPGMIYAQPTMAHHAPTGNTGLPSGTSSTSGTAVPAVTDADAGLMPIKSPMVGTFYTSSSPDAKAFVTVGSAVDEDTDVCIIEAMKVFNNIKAEMRGTISKILVGNGETVEFGQPLFLVKPA